ncbi:MAG: AMP-binding protein [Acidimicrobiales bacterium]
MAELTRTAAEERPDEVAMVDEFNRRTCAEVNERTNRLVHAVRDAGMKVGDVAGVLTNNRIEFFEITGALSHTGVTFVPINWHFTADEVAYILDDSGATALFADDENADLAVEAAGRVPAVTTKVVFGGPAPEGFADYEDMLAAANPDEPADQTAGFVMFYTSGTTGRPKGVKSSMVEIGGPLDAISFAIEGFAGLLQMPRDGAALVNSPVYHAGPYLLSVVPANVGNKLVIRRRFDPAETLQLIDEESISIGYAVPTQFVRLLRLPEETKDAFDGSSLQYVFHTAAPCPPEVKRQMIEWWGPVIFEYYGASEGAGNGTAITSEEWLERPGSVGRPLPTCELLILDDEGNRLGPNEVGQIYFKSLMGTDFEYHNAPEKTAESHLEPGVFTFGDIGYVDEDGYLFLSDRKIDMIISGGVNIYPAEIEAELLNHPKVRDVGVFGVPNEEFGEEVKAVVQPAEGVAGSGELAAELMAHCREHLAGYKCPRSIDFVDDFPRTETGKLQKRDLRDPYWDAADRAI